MSEYNREDFYIISAICGCAGCYFDTADRLCPGWGCRKIIYKRKEKPPVEGKKYDQGKPMVGLMKKDFSRALLAVAAVTTYGVKKYNAPGSWKKVENAKDRYEDALGRHDLGCNLRKIDEESGMLEKAHRAWNALATLELELAEMEHEKNTFEVTDYEIEEEKY